MDRIQLEYRFMEETDSTNVQIKRLAEEGALQGLVLSADRQTAGRGRSGHTWEAPKGDSVATSLLLYPEGIADDRLVMLTPLAALAVCDAIEGLYGLTTQIKWVNDVLIQKKKVCGILTERMQTADGRRAVIIGIGINVYQEAFGGDLERIATSIRREMDGRMQDFPDFPGRRRLTEAVWESFLSYYMAFLSEKDLAFVREEYNERLVNRNRRCRVLDPKGAYEGTALGIDERGRLAVRPDEGGDLRLVDSGEVSVRGIYGYV